MSSPTQMPARAPMDAGQILNRVWGLARANAKLFVGLAAVPPLVMYGLLAVVAAAVLVPVLSRLHQTPSSQTVVKILLVIAPVVILIFILYWLAFAVYFAAGSHAGIQADRGERTTFGEAYTIAWSEAGRYFVLLLIIYAICFFPSIIVQLAMAASVGISMLNREQPNPLIFLMFPFAGFLQMVLLVGGFIVALRFSLAFPAAVAENLAPVQALRRSGILTRGVKLKIFLVLLVIYAATYIAIMILIFGMVLVIAIGVLVFSATTNFASPFMVGLIAVACLTFIMVMTLFMACSWAGYTTALCVIYNDQRRCLDPVEPSGALA